MKNNNKGFTLVEFIVVLGIIAIVTSAAFFGFGYLSMADCKKCATRINSSLGTAKSKTMSKAVPTNMFIYMYNGDYYIKYDENMTVTKDGDAEKIGNSNLTMRVIDVAGNTLNVTNGTEPIRVTYSRKDGSFDFAPQEITVTESGGTSKSVYLVTDTGKHFIR